MSDRVRLSRAKGWTMPAGTAKVDRTTKWGNPFVVGRHGTAAECVQLYRYLIFGGLVCMSVDPDCVEAQRRTFEVTTRDWRELKGLRLACWCRPGDPCHADVLAEFVAFLEAGERAADA